METIFTLFHYNQFICEYSGHSLVISLMILNPIGGGVLAVPRDPDAVAPGEMGRPVILPTNMSVQTKKLVDDGWLNNAFNQYASDLISVHRSLPDPRDQW